MKPVRSEVTSGHVAAPGQWRKALGLRVAFPRCVECDGRCIPEVVTADGPLCFDCLESLTTGGPLFMVSDAVIVPPETRDN